MDTKPIADLIGAGVLAWAGVKTLDIIDRSIERSNGFPLKEVNGMTHRRGTGCKKVKRKTKRRKTKRRKR